jgi:hypothetical protein
VLKCDGKGEAADIGLAAYLRVRADQLAEALGPRTVAPFGIGRPVTDEHVGSNGRKITSRPPASGK